MMDYTSLRHIFFDLDHTLWDYERNSTETLMELFHQFSLNALGLGPENQFIQTFHKANLSVWDLFDENRMNREELRDKRLELVFSEYGLEPIAIEGFHDAYYQKCSAGKHLMKGCVETLERLRQKFELHIITNGFDDAQYAKLENSGIRPYFRTVTTSENAGSKKPDPEYFQFALEQAGATATNSLIVGDGLRTDVTGGINSGLKVIWFNPENKVSPFPEIQSIRKLEELSFILAD